MKRHHHKSVGIGCRKFRDVFVPWISVVFISVQLNEFTASVFRFLFRSLKTGLSF